MNITTKQVLQHFLSQHQKVLATAKVFEHSPFFKDFFTRTELIEIIKYTYGTKESEVANQGKAWKSDMLAIINNADILSFYLNQWELASSEHSPASLKSEVVDKVLRQIVPTHYLNEKAIAEWDRYDHANYKSLLIKAGRIQKVYGIYDTFVSQDEVNTADPEIARFYDSHEQAEEALQEIINNGRMYRHDLHILYTYTSI